MSDGIKRMYEDADEYQRLADKYSEPVRCVGRWPYDLDWKHFYALERRERAAAKPATPEKEGET